MEKDNIEYIKQLIQEEGGYVSCVEPMGPLTMLFFTIRPENTETVRYDRRMLEYDIWRLDDADELRPHIRDIIADSNGMAPVFSVYRVYRNPDNKLIIRAGWINSIWGGKNTTETTYEEAKELIKNPPDNQSHIHWEDMKTVYKL